MDNKTGPKSLGEAIKEFLSNYKHTGKLLESQVVESWPKVMGPSIASLTQSVQVKNGTLYVYLKSSVLRNELMMHRSKIVKAINHHLEVEVIRDLIVR